MAGQDLPPVPATLRGQGSHWSCCVSPDALQRAFGPSFRAVALLLALLLTPVALHAAGREYHAEALAWVASQLPGSPGVPTHLRVEGEVAYVHRETDGDVHIRVCHNGRCMVAECIPGLPVSRVVTRGGAPHSEELVTRDFCQTLRVGQRVGVYGISRYDGAPGHGEMAEPGERGGGHWEIHPVEGIEVLPPLPGARP